jgi:hypothetical protein
MAHTLAITLRPLRDRVLVRRIAEGDTWPSPSQRGEEDVPLWRAPVTARTGSPR